MNSAIRVLVIASLIVLLPVILATTVTEDEERVYCMAPVEGDYSDNLLGIAQVGTEAACEAECKVLPGCNFFTYHGNSTASPGDCLLQTEVREPITPCKDGSCSSGFQNCDQDLCGYLHDGELYPNGIVVTESTDIGLILIGSCDTPLAVAVGGGGLTHGDAGSGSGFVEFEELSVDGPYTQYSATVGAAREISWVKDEVGTTVLRAYAGNDGQSNDGASGYSGGGADCDDVYCYPGGDGGYNGGDGEDSMDHRGGEGSRLDLTSIPLRNIVLR